VGARSVGLGSLTAHAAAAFGSGGSGGEADAAATAADAAMRTAHIGSSGKNSGQAVGTAVLATRKGDLSSAAARAAQGVSSRACTAPALQQVRPPIFVHKNRQRDKVFRLQIYYNYT
jgi:Tfp pilus assembly protein FimV